MTLLDLLPLDALAHGFLAAALVLAAAALACGAAWVALQRRPPGPRAAHIGLGCRRAAGALAALAALLLIPPVLLALS